MTQLARGLGLALVDGPAHPPVTGGVRVVAGPVLDGGLGELLS
jgi:hypothetical protein